jgi:hypothetical protein
MRMSGLSMMRRPHVLIAASIASMFGGLGGVAEVQRTLEVRGVGSTIVNADPSRPTPAPRATSNLVKMRDLSFFRGRPSRRQFKGVPMSVAEGKRRARKARNRARHKVHATKARRRA